MTAERLIVDSLHDILDAASAAIEFLSGLTKDEFVLDRKSQFAVIRALEIIGEASRRVPLSFRGDHPETPWAAMSGMRDKLIHDYFGVSLDVVWRTVHDDLHPLRNSIANLLNQMNSRDSSEAHP